MSKTELIFTDEEIDRIAEKIACKLKTYNNDYSWRGLLWEGETIDGEFMRGQLFRFYDHYYICNNVPYTLGDCWEMSLAPPVVSQWHEMKLNTLKKCEWEYEDSNEQNC